LISLSGALVVVSEGVDDIDRLLAMREFDAFTAGQVERSPVNSPSDNLRTVSSHAFAKHDDLVDPVGIPLERPRNSTVGLSTLND
jgi:hypothetical protein